MESSRRLTLLLAVVYSAVAVPVTRRETCARHCTESNRFQFSPGKTYTYDYETMTTTDIKGTSDERSHLQIKAQVDIEILSKCDLSMRLRGVSLKQSNPQNPDYMSPIRGGREFARTAEKYILRFSYQDGVVQELCPDPEAPSWVTNIHRGVLSAFQNSMNNLEGTERLIETDVSGKCSVEYQSLGRSWRGTITIRKIKDLNACTNRQDADTSFRGSPFTHGSPMRSLPMIKGTQECVQSIGSGIIDSSTCTETHVVRPFSRGNGGATTTVTQKLTYATASEQTFTGNDYRPTRAGLLFDHGKEEDVTGRNDEEAERALAKLCEASVRDVTISVPGLFASFVYKMRQLNYDAFRSLYSRVETVCPDNPKARKFFLDAVPVISTLSSVKFMSEMIARREIPESEVNFWFSSLSFVSEPTTEMIITLTPLLDGPYEQAFFGISSLVHTFCEQNDCSASSEVRNIVHKLAANLGENCYNPDVRRILLILKSIGNIGLPFGREKILERCAMNPQLETEVRIAAIQAFRRFDCETSRETFLKMYGNYNEGSEMRIAAYLASMACPTQETIELIKTTLNEEQINQVGSFVWTHLRALSKSQHPDRHDIKDILSSLYLLNKYESDIRKFSSARESTFYLESIDSGLHVDTHLIYPTHSYLPHSATFNLTVDIFGHSCNLLQLDGRLEGMEYMVEKFFGPNGYFPQKKVSKLLRNKRAISDNKIDQMDREFDVKSKFDKKPYGSLDVKIFGNTMWFNQFEEDEQGKTSVNLMDLVTNLARKQEKEFSRSFMFLDTTYAIPMATGLPLRFSVNGTATVGLKLGGKFNVHSMEDIDVVANIEPSGAVEMAGLLTVDAGGVTTTGLRMAATLHSSTVLDSRLEVRNGQVVKAHLNVPREKIEILDVQSKLFLVYGSEEREQVGQRDNHYHFNKCSGEMSRKVFGMELCTDVSLPKGQRNSPMYPMSGAASFSMYLKKTDPTLTSYTFDASYETKSVQGKSIRDASISLNTPGSTVDREVSLLFHLSEPDNTLTFDLKSPVKKFGLIAKFSNGKSHKKLDLSTTVDEKHTFSAKGELRINSDGNGVSYFPSLTVQIPSRRLLSVDGSAHLKHGQKYGGQLAIKDLTERPIIFRGNLDIQNKNRYEGELTVSSFALESTTKASLQRGDNIILKMNTDYRIMDSNQYKININGKIRDLSANALTKYTGVLNMQATAFPEWDTSVSWEAMKTMGHVESSFSISVGDGTRSRVHTITLQEIVSYQGNLQNNNAEILLKFTYPQRRLHYALDMKHANTERTLKNELEVQYAKSRKISTLVDLNLHNENSVDFSGDVQVRYPGRKTRLSTELRETSPRNYRSEVNVQWQEGQQVGIVAHYRNKGTEDIIKQEVDAEVTFSYRQPMTFSCSVGAQGGHYTGLAEANLGLDKYRINADYVKGQGLNHRFSGEVLYGSDLYVTNALMQNSYEKFTTSAELKFPSRRRVVGKLDVKNGDSFKTISFESMWDADRDPTKRFGVEGDLRMKNNGYDGKLTIQIERRTIRGFLSTSREGSLFGNYLRSLYKSELQWSPKDKVTMTLNTNIVRQSTQTQISSSLDVQTLYPGYETVTLNVKHGLRQQQWSSEASMLWGNNKRIYLSTDGEYLLGITASNIKANLKFRSPFKNYEFMSFNGSHFHDRQGLTNQMQLQWNRNNKITSDISCTLTNSEFKGTVKVTTPFDPVTDLVFEARHVFESGNYKTNGAFQWGAGKRITAAVDLRHMLRGRRRTFSLNVIGNTPFRGYEMLSSKVIYNNDGTTLNTDTEIQYGLSRRITGGFTGSFQNSYYSKSLEGKLYFTSPFANYETMQASTTFQCTSDSYKYNLDVQGPYDKSISLNSEGKIASWQNIEVNIILDGRLPFYRGFQRLSFDLVHKLQNNNLRSTFDVVYGRKQITVLVTGVSKPGYRSQNLEGSLSIKTPINGFEEIKVDAIYKQENEEYMTRLEASQNREHLLFVQNTNVRDYLNIESNFHLTSSIRNMKNIKGSLSQIYNPGFFTHDTKLQWSENKEIAFVTQYQSKISSKELNVRLNTPFEPLKTFTLSANYIGHSDYKTKVSAQWNSEKEVSYESRISSNRMQQVEAEIRLTSNIDILRTYQFNGKYDITTEQKTGDLAFEWNHGMKRTINLRGTALLSRHSPRFDITLSTPYRHFQRMSLTGSGENRSFKKMLSLAYERNRIKISTSGKIEILNDGTRCEITFNSPYQYAENLSLYAKYQKAGGRLSGETEAQWAVDRKVSLGAELSRGDYGANWKVSLATPFENYKTLSMDGDFDVSQPKRVVSVVLRWGKGQKIEMSADCETTEGRTGEFNVHFRSPFKNLQRFDASSHYQTSPEGYNGDLKVNVGNQVYNSEINYNRRETLVLSLNTPHRPYRNMVLTVNFLNNPGHRELNTKLKYENKEIDVGASLKNNDNRQVEVKLFIKTPFENFKSLSIDGTFENQEFGKMHARLNVATPFEILRQLDISTTFTAKSDMYDAFVKVSTPPKTVTVTGQLKNSPQNPFGASFSIEAPFSSYLNFAVQVQTDLENKAEASLTTPYATHSLVGTLNIDDSSYELELKMQSPLLEKESLRLILKSNFKDSRSAMMDGTLEIAGERHTLVATYRHPRNDYETEVNIRSSLLPEGKAELKGTYTRRRQRQAVDAKLSYARSTHQLKCSYEADSRQLAAEVSIDSSLLPSSSIRSNAKYVNGNNRDLELVFTLETPEDKHSIVASIKNYENEKFFQIKIDCPALYSKQFSVTGTFKNDQLNAVDGTVTVTYHRKELRIAANMKRDGWKNVEGFLTLNTPFESLRMLRIDTGFKNSDFRNMEWNAQVESSNPNYPSVSITAKLSRSSGSEDVSLVLRMPNTEYHTIQILGNLHYNMEMTAADGRVTLALLQKRYSAYGHYDYGHKHLAVDGELEWLNKKWNAVTRLENKALLKEITFVLNIPDHGVFETGCSLIRDGNQYNFKSFYNDPQQNLFKANATISYTSLANFDVTADATTPFEKFHQVNFRLQQQRIAQERIHIHSEGTINYRKAFFTVTHRRNSPEKYYSSITIGSTLRSLRELKLVLVRDGLQEMNLDFSHNQERKVKIHMTDSRSTQVVKVDLPTLPFAVTAKLRPRENGKEISLKSSCPTRTMVFSTQYQNTPGYFTHETTLTWDEAARKTFSYVARLTDISKGQTVGKEVFGRMNFPRRSLELRGKLARSSRVQSGGVNFYWDADRDMSKNITIGVEHLDVSTRHQTSHKLHMTLTHPALSKDLVQSNVLLVSPTEFRVKSELQYSRYNDHHLVAEMKASDLSRNGDSHYKSELSLRHLISHLDFKMLGEATNNREEASAHLKISNADRSGRHSLRELNAKILKLRKEIDIMMRSGQSNLSILGKMANTEDGMSMTLDQKTNNERSLYSELNFNRRLRSLDVNVTMGENKGIRVTASFPEDSASVKVSHSTVVNSVSDAFIFVGLEKSRVLRSRVNWRPGMWRDFRIVTGDTLRELALSMSKGARDISSELTAEYNNKIQDMGRAFQDQVSSFQDSLKRDFAAVSDDMNAASDTLRRMYKNNEFYVQDIQQELKEYYRAFRSLCDTSVVLLETLYTATMEWLDDFYHTIWYTLEDLSNYLREKRVEFLSYMSSATGRTLRRLSHGWELLCRKTSENLQRFGDIIGNMVESVGTRIDNWVRWYAPCVIDAYYIIRNTADNIRETIKSSFNSIAESVTSHPLYEALANYWSQVKATIEGFQLADLTSSVQSRVLFLGEQAGAFMNRLTDGDLVDIIRNRLPVEYVSGMAKVTLQKGVDLYGALGVDRLLRNLYSYATEYFKDVALSSGHDILHRFYEVRDGAKYNFDPKHGVFAFEYVLPTSSNSLYDVFNVGKYAEYHKMEEIKDTLISKYYKDFCIWDFYYKIKNFFSPRQWMPPFTAHAMVAGNQHFVTFDKFAFDFAGECSYLLARDFVDGNFTVVANYKRDGTKVYRKSLTVITETSKLDISHDYKVTLNDVKVELPIKIANTVAIREGSMVRIENERKGFVVVCNFVYDICTVGMSGFYFGKTGGLFGTYDYEPRLDFLTPEMTLATDVENFANSWEVGQATCRRTANMATLPGNDYMVREKCKELFSATSSTFRACFKQVNPEPFMNMCISDLSVVDPTNFDSAICVSAAAYFTECKIEGVQLKMPKPCVRCDTEHGTPMVEGDVAKFHRNHQARSADVVFIVEEKECNVHNYKVMEKLAHSIEDNYRQQGFLDVRYRVVGFGGDDVHAEPHIHTIDGMEYGSVRSVESAFQSLQVGDGPTNMLEALRFAAGLNYHPGSVKSFVLMKCSICKTEDITVDYGEVLRTLLDGEITLHLLMEQKYEMRIAKNTKARKVIGLDKHFAYTLKDIKDSNLLGDGDLLIHLKMPKDICVPLALELNGSTFDSQYLTDMRRNNYKKFMDVLSRRMALSSKHHGDWTMCCECIATADGVGKSTCQRCVSPEVANMISDDENSLFSPKQSKKDTENKPKVRKSRERKRGH